MNPTTCGTCGETVYANFCTSCGSPRVAPLAASEADARAAAREHELAAGRRATLIGLAVMVGGAAVTLATYELASGGGRYMVLWGAVIFGAIGAVRGLVTMFRAGPPVPATGTPGPYVPPAPPSGPAAPSA